MIFSSISEFRISRHFLTHWSDFGLAADLTFVRRNDTNWCQIFNDLYRRVWLSLVRNTQPTFCRLLQRVDARKVEEVIVAIQEQV